MTTDELKAIRERCEKATNGPWSWVADGPSARTVIDGHCEVIARRVYNEDAEFIAAAYTDIPLLLDELQKETESADRTEKMYLRAVEIANDRGIDCNRVYEENARLREALKGIAECTADGFYPQMKARAALEEK